MPHAPNGAAALSGAAHIDPRVYSDDEVFRWEMERLFGRAWIAVGHDSLIREPGAYFTAWAGSHPIVILRDRDRGIRAFHNRCPHRGARLCSAPRGSAASFVCPYHGWVFGTDGGLKSVPAPEEYDAGFALADWGLAPVADLALYRGFIFVRHTAEGPDLVTFLGDMTSSLDDLVDRAPDGELEACPVPLRHRYRGNWKLQFENLNDTHHARVAHGATVRAATRVLNENNGDSAHSALGIMKANGMPIRDFSQLDLVTSEYGHSYIFGFIDGQKKQVFPPDYVARLEQRRGAAEAERILAVNRHLTLLYPSATLQGRFQSLRLIQPIRPDLTEVVGYLFRLKGAPDSMFEEALHYFHVSMSPFSPVASDDFELYEGIQDIARTPADRTLPVSRLLDPGGAARANTHRATSEVFIRNQYAAWRSYMAQPAP